ncbi:VWA-like domain-containing protein [Methylobacterium sp. 285MFTsu5.1]|uniref:vWA domain-containing protein n=1 Tax=Methylobacterium sp. 285MFTsu5.1 TaxID=1172187 RepID=UPI000360CA56|nr:VWA-like domain-containing protein [Methylobacterium sp. 285MFTsu5.1]
MQTATLDRKQQRAWTETRTTFLYNCPAFSHLLYTLLSHNGETARFTTDVPIAATDGTHIFLNPDTFLTMTLAERVFVLGHEVAHAMFGHCEWLHGCRVKNEVRYPDGKVLPYNDRAMNVALDYFINAMLVDAGIGQMPKVGCYDKKYTTEMPSLDIYRAIYKEQNLPENFDQHLDPGTGDGTPAAQAAQDRNEQVWKTEIAAALASAKAQGNLPAALERALGEMLDPKVNWQDHIRALFARKIGSGGNDWRRPDRRLITRKHRIVSPGRSGYGCDTIVVGVDTSGSIGQQTLAHFFGEMGGILEDLNPRQLIVIWCDAKVHRTDTLEDMSDLNQLRAKKAPGGGGTSFEPVFQEVFDQRIQPDALVYLTDGLGVFPPTEPKYPVIWGSIYEDAKYPWGEVVQIPQVTG